MCVTFINTDDYKAPSIKLTCWHKNWLKKIQPATLETSAKPKWVFQDYNIDSLSLV